MEDKRKNIPEGRLMRERIRSSWSQDGRFYFYLFFSANDTLTWQGCVVSVLKEVWGGKGGCIRSDIDVIVIEKGVTKLVWEEKEHKMNRAKRNVFFFPLALFHGTFNNISNFHVVNFYCCRLAKLCNYISGRQYLIRKLRNVAKTR